MDDPNPTLKRTRSSTRQAAAASALGKSSTSSNGATPAQSVSAAKSPSKRSKTSPTSTTSEKAPTSSRSTPYSSFPIHAVTVLGADSVSLGYGITNYVTHKIVEIAPSSTYVIATDTNIAALHLSTLVSSLNDAISSSSL
ncbi:hypothetical protein HDU84_000186, partial [Entophlyctis sp. JEL0112]